MIVFFLLFSELAVPACITCREKMGFLINENVPSTLLKLFPLEIFEYFQEPHKC